MSFLPRGPRSTDPIELPGEEWRTIPEFPAFEVSSLGRVRRGGFILRGGRSPKGYRSIVTYPGERLPNGKLKPVRFSVHRAVCRAFHGPVDDLKATTLLINAAHLNGDVSDNSAENLAWVSAKENTFHRKLHGTQPLGSNCWNARLTPKAVHEIRRRADGGERHPSIAKTFGISREHARDIANRKKWTHLAEINVGSC